MKKFFNDLREFFINLLSDSPKVSSKRFTLITALILIVSMVIAHICKVQIDSNIFYATVALAGLASGLTVTEKIFSK